MKDALVMDITKVTRYQVSEKCPNETCLARLTGALKRQWIYCSVLVYFYSLLSETKIDME